MDSSLKETLNDKFEDLVKLVVLGFIAFDFFSPLTFKYIAKLSEQPLMRMDLFVGFKVPYVTLPILCYLSPRWCSSPTSKIV